MRKLLCVALVAGACTGADEGGIPAGQRLFTARVNLAAPDVPPGGRRALQLVGVYADPTAACDGAVRVGDAGATTVAACARFGDPFDPDRDEAARLLAPCDRTVNLLLGYIGATGGQSPGELIAVLAYPDGATTTTLAAREPGCRDTAALATNVVDLGTLAVTDGDTLATVVAGGVNGGKSALATIDTDGDAVANASDPDDDGDGLDDASDDDDDDDGAADAAQVFEASWMAP